MKIYNYEGKANVIGPRVKQVRKQLKLSQDELAAKMQVKNIDVTQRVISRIETQERFVADFELRALAEILDVDIYWLLGTDDNCTAFQKN